MVIFFSIMIISRMVLLMAKVLEVAGDLDLVDVLPWGGLEARSAPLRMRLEEAAMRDVLVEPELR